MAVEKNIIPVSVESRYVAVGDHVPIAAGNVGFDFVDIALDSEWTGLDIFVTFAGCAYQPTTVDYASELEVPSEQISDPCKLYIGVRGYNTSSGVTIDEENQLVENGAIPVLNTTAMRIPIYVQESGASGGAAPTQPTPDTLSRVQQDIIVLEKLVDGADEILESVDAAVKSAQQAVSDVHESYETAEAARDESYQAAEQARYGAFDAAEQTREQTTSAAASAANSAASAANAAAASVDASKQAAEQAASAANSAASAANTAASNATSAAASATSAASSATSAATDATAAADDARQAAEEARGAVSQDMSLYLTYETVGDTDYLTLVDVEEA